MPVPSLSEGLHVFVLNLPSAVERRTLVEQELSRVGLVGTFVPGVDASSLSDVDWGRYNRRRCRAIYGVDMLPTELACYLGHERILRRIVDEGIEVALVLEDDVWLEDTLIPVLDALLGQTRPWPWMVVRLASLRGRKILRGIQTRHRVTSLGAEHGLYKLSTHVLGAQGYVVTREGAERMLRYGRRIALPFDHAMDRFWENGLTPYVVYPFVLGERGELSSIIGDRDPARRYAMGPWVLWRRRVSRWLDGAAKRWYVLRHG